MKLYRNDDMTAALQWAGTQADANKAFGRGRWEAVEVPTDKAGLIAYLNDYRPDSLNGSKSPTIATPAPPQPEPQRQPEAAPRDPASVANWIMDTATPREIELLFEALGVRFHEMRKAAKP